MTELSVTDGSTCSQSNKPQVTGVLGRNGVPCQRCCKKGSASLEPMALQGSSEDMGQSLQSKDVCSGKTVLVRIGQMEKRKGVLEQPASVPSTGPGTVPGSLANDLGASRSSQNRSERAHELKSVSYSPPFLV